MITTTLSWIAEKVNGKLLKGAADVEVSAVSTDTRTLEDGAVYLALKGPNFNGHDFISTAEKAGASAVIASEDAATSLPVIMVEDTKEALGLLLSLIHI
ncbi:Mur ligase domain-containing protein, partial [Alteromonas sp. MCA-1]|uniref:Mur ligase domain-containing protein n=1 Tax=Alteromonas sp. MCA-1 TaxID=2917731 RepID=UPI001EF97FFF